MKNVTSREFRRWLAQQGAVFKAGKGSPLKVYLNGRQSVLPMHNAELKTRSGRGNQETTRLEIGERVFLYPVTLKRDEDGGFVATFKDIPEAITQRETEAEALAAARDALETALDFYFEDNRAVPLPSKAKPRQPVVELPASLSAKILLLNEMIQQHVRPAELARRLKTTPQEVNRLTNIQHTSRIDGIAAALKALGKRLDMRTV